MFDLVGFGANGWGPALLRAALMTLGLSAADFLSGVALGVLAAFARLSGVRFARGAAFAYSALFRGVPDLLAIYLLYFGGSVALTTIGAGPARADLSAFRASRPEPWRSGSFPAPIRRRSTAAPF